MTRVTAFALGILVGFLLASLVVGMQQNAQMASLTNDISELHEDQANLCRWINEFMYSKNAPVDHIIVNPMLAKDGYPDTETVTDASGVQ